MVTTHGKFVKHFFKVVPPLCTSVIMSDVVYDMRHTPWHYKPLSDADKNQTNDFGFTDTNILIPAPIPTGAILLPAGVLL